MGRRFLFELLQDRTFLLFLHGFSGLPGKQIGQTGIDPIHNQIGTVAGSAAVLQHGNGPASLPPRRNESLSDNHGKA